MGTLAENLAAAQTQLATLQAAHDILEAEFETIKAQAKASDLSYSSAMSDYELGNVDAEFLADKKTDYLADRQEFEEKLSELNAKKSAIATVSATVKDLTIKSNATTAIAKIDELISYIDSYNSISTKTYESIISFVTAIHNLDLEIRELTDLWTKPVSLGNYLNVSISELLSVQGMKQRLSNIYISNFKKDFMTAVKARLNTLLN